MTSPDPVRLLPPGAPEETALMRELADHAAIGFSLYEMPSAPGQSGRFSFVNAAYLQLLGLPSELALSELGTALLNSVHQDDRHQAHEMLAELRAGRSTNQTMRMLRPDGTTRWVRSRRTPIMDAAGGLVRIAGTAEDITELKVAALALRESQEWFRQLADNVPVGFTLTHLSDPPRLVYWNSAFLRILGVDSAADVRSVDYVLASYVHPEDIATWRAGLGEILAGRQVDHELRILRADGQLRWVRLRRSPVRDENGVVFRAAGTTEDITDRKLAEAALRSARSEADRANAAKNEFLSRMSHELRTPLNAVLGFAQLLEMDSLDESQADAVGYILRGGRHLLALINDVLDIAGIEADRLELSVEPVQVGTALEDALRLVEPQARDADVELSFDATAAAALYVQADQRRLRQVLINLLSNAVKYNRRDGRVVVSAAAVSDSRIRLAVADNGIGIRDEDMARLFVPFDRLGQQASGIEGAGIGLALSQRLVAFMGGHFDARSVHGSGSEFGVTLPRADAVVEHSPLKSRSGPAWTEPAAVRSTLLYIEDNHSNVRLLERILQRRPGWTLVHTDRGRRGIELVGECNPTLVLLDLHLPDMDGIDVLRELRAHPGGAGLPLVVASADASPGQISRLMAAGVDAYITKPLDVSDVLAVLDEHTPAPDVSATPARQA